MSKFFDSELVRESLMELEKLQEKIFNEMFQLPFFDKDQKRGHIELMREFLEKQKLFIFRLSLSDDPEAIEMKDKIMESAKIFGLKKNEGLDKFFSMMESTIEKLEKALDE